MILFNPKSPNAPTWFALGVMGRSQEDKGTRGQAFTSHSPAADDAHSGLPGNNSSGTESGNLQGTDSHFIPMYENCTLYFLKREKIELTQRKHDI